jgi:archaellum component FlaF (FlaF/FlaG flagellin family)
VKTLVKVVFGLGLVVGILWLLQKSDFQCQKTITKSDTTIVHDTSWSVKIERFPVYTPGPSVTLPGDTQYLLQPVDTMAILRAFYAKHVYNDTIWIDSFGYVCWVDTVTQNKIAKRQKSTNYKIPVITKTITINNYYEPSRQVNVTGQVDPIASILYGGISYEDRKDRIYHLSAGLGKGGLGGVMIGLSIPVWKETPLMKKISK